MSTWAITVDDADDWRVKSVQGDIANGYPSMWLEVEVTKIEEQA